MQFIIDRIETSERPAETYQSLTRDIAAKWPDTVRLTLEQESTVSPHIGYLPISTEVVRLIDRLIEYERNERMRREGLKPDCEVPELKSDGSLSHPLDKGQKVVLALLQCHVHELRDFVATTRGLSNLQKRFNDRLHRLVGEGGQQDLTEIQAEFGQMEKHLIRLYHAAHPLTIMQELRGILDEANEGTC